MPLSKKQKKKNNSKIKSNQIESNQINSNKKDLTYFFTDSIEQRRK